MAEEDDVKPSEQRGGTNVGDTEAREKGGWVESASDGIVPAELGGSDAPESELAGDPDYSEAALGRTTDSDEPATAQGIDLSAGDQADATTAGGQKPPEGAEPDLRDVGEARRRADAG